MKKGAAITIICSLALIACKTEDKQLYDRVEKKAFVGTINKNISTHFKQFNPELYKYRGLAPNEALTTTFKESQIAKELELFEIVKNSKFINKPTDGTFALCHNILIHSPEKGKEFLKLLNKSTENQEIIKNLYTEFLFTGEFGEQLVIDNVESTNDNWRKTWSHYLSTLAIYDSSIPRIEKIINQTNDEDVKLDLISAIMSIGNLKSIKLLKNIIETTTNEKIQTKAIYALTELLGKDGITYFEDIKCLGNISKEEKITSIAWLRLQTSAKNKFGIKVTNDIGFVEKFGNIKSPAIIWLKQEGLLNKENVKTPTLLSKEKKDELLNLLIESKGFGIEAAKAQLFLSIEQSDTDKLLTLRNACCYSPNNFTKERMNTIGIFIRHLRKIKV